MDTGSSGFRIASEIRGKMRLTTQLDRFRPKSSSSAERAVHELRADRGIEAGLFCARWSTALVMPPSQILREYRLVAQKKNAHGTPWTKEDERELRAHSKARTPLPQIAKKMKRTERALRRKAGILGIGLGHRR